VQPAAAQHVPLLYGEVHEPFALVVGVLYGRLAVMLGLVPVRRCFGYVQSLLVYEVPEALPGEPTVQRERRRPNARIPGAWARYFCEALC
jgi:hypothetical protein